MMYSCRPLLLALFTGVFANAAGLVISRTDKGFEFADASSVLINGKDKALTLGSQPAITGPINKLDDVKVAGILLKDAGSKVIASYEASGQIEYLLPQGTTKTAAPDAAALWESAKISIKKTESDKAPLDIPFSTFVGFVPSGLAGLTKLCTDSRAMQLVGGKDAGFEAQIGLIEAVVKAYGPTPDTATIEKFIELSMRERYEAFENGTAGVDALNQGLTFARVSAGPYDGHAEHKRLRDLLTAKKTHLDRKLAALRALFVAGDWDSYVAGYKDIEKYQASFAELADKRIQALKSSVQAHQAIGKQRMAEGEHRLAFRELRLASMRNPADMTLQKDVAMAWTEYSRQVAVDAQGKRKQLNSGQRDAITQALHFADRYKQEKKLDEALKSVIEAESIDRESLPLLLKKAEILAARNELGKALEILDAYDMMAIEDQRPAGNRLRNEVTFQLTNVLKEMLPQVEKAWEGKRFHEAWRLAASGLGLKQDDPDLLYVAGLSALVTRQRREGISYLKKYLDVSNTLTVKPERRLRALSLLSSIREEPAAKEDGVTNWLSGKALPKGVYYCPLSLAFQPKTQRVAAKKMRLEFVWSGDRLKSIVPSFEKANESTGERPIYFGYVDARAPLAALSYTDGGASVPADADTALAQAPVLLPNSPLIDAAVVEKLSGEPVTVTVAGNPYFHPFVWQRAYRFQTRYDGAGRMKSAKQLPETDTPAGTLKEAEFEWDGMKLQAVRVYQPAGGQKSLVYERKLQYLGDRLVGEEAHSRGKVSRIKYVYVGDELVSAEADKDEAIDDRSREVSFTAAGSKSR